MTSNEKLAIFLRATISQCQQQLEALEQPSTCTRTADRVRTHDAAPTRSYGIQEVYATPTKAKARPEAARTAQTQRSVNERNRNFYSEGSQQ